MAEPLRLAVHADAPALLRRRAALRAGLRRLLDERGLVEVAAPTLLPHAGQEPSLHPPRVSVEGLGELWLQTSPELPLKRLLAAGCPALYSLGPAYRGGVEELSPHHQPEFELLEWYRPGASVDDLIADVRALGRAGAAALGVAAPDEGRELGVREACWRFAGVDARPLFDGDRAAFARAARASGLACGDDDDVATLLGRVLVERLEPAFAKLPGWTFLRDYPAALAVLGTVTPGEPPVADRVEAYLGGLELANGWVELWDADELERRWEADAAERDGPAPPRDAELLEALRRAAPGPTVGMALGVDRLALALLGGETLADVRALSLGVADRLD